jgi:hypothetical protein
MCEQRVALVTSLQAGAAASFRSNFLNSFDSFGLLVYILSVICCTERM